MPDQNKEVPLVYIDTSVWLQSILGQQPHAVTDRVLYAAAEGRINVVASWLRPLRRATGQAHLGPVAQEARRGGRSAPRNGRSGARRLLHDAGQEGLPGRHVRRRGPGHAADGRLERGPLRRGAQSDRVLTARASPAPRRLTVEHRAHGLGVPAPPPRAVGTTAKFKSSAIPVRVIPVALAATMRSTTCCPSTGGRPRWTPCARFTANASASAAHQPALPLRRGSHH